MQFKRSEVVRVLEALGWGNAGSWTKERLMSKVKQLPSTVSEDDPTGDEECDRLLTEMISAVKDDDDVITIEDDMKKDKDEKPAKSEKAEKPVKAAEKKPTKAAKSVGSATKPVRVPKKPAKAAEKKPAKSEKAEKPVKAVKERSSSEKRPGVIATIVTVLAKATSKNPVTKAQVLEELTKAFPDRGADAMKATVNAQLPNRLGKTHNIQRNDNGFWIAK